MSNKKSYTQPIYTEDNPHPLKGRKQSPEHIAKRTANRKLWKKNKHTEEYKAKLSQRMLGNKINLGKVQTAETRRKRSNSLKGERCHLWKGGINAKNDSIRKSVEYKLWRESVFKKDNYTCQDCKVRGKNLHAHHIKPFALYPELRFDVNNGKTLCIECHKKTETYGHGTQKLAQELNITIV